MLDSWPRDKLVAVALLIAVMTPDSKAAMVRIKRDDLFPDHTGMADFIRQHFGLWDGNMTLIASLIKHYQELAHLVRPGPLTTRVSRDHDDDHVIACALAAKADLIVTGDYDLLDLKAYKGIRIVAAKRCD